MINKKLIIAGAVAALFSTMLITGCSAEPDIEIANNTESIATNEDIEEASDEASEEASEAADKAAEGTDSGAIVDAGESTESAEGSGESTEESAMDTDEVKRAVNSFGEKLYNSYDSEDNLFFSPYSMASAIAIADIAAKGDTKAGIEEALSIDDFDAFKDGIKAFNAKEQSESAYLDTANGLFISNSLKLSPGYEEGFETPAKEYFNGEFKSVDFHDSETVKKEISEWVKDATRGMIADYESAVDENTAADILNAVYFYGEWQSKFRANDTYEQTFHGKNGDSETDMMHQDDVYFRYVPDENGVKAVALPYGDGSYEMDVLMYRDSDKKDISRIFEDISLDDLLAKLDSAEEERLSMLALPKFKMDVKLDGLKDRLISLGMDTAFSDSADFSALADDMKVSDILHRAVVEVDEEGSRAAAVTEVIMELTALPPDSEPTEDFIADRSFAFLIRDKESGLILFMGRLSDTE